MDPEEVKPTGAESSSSTDTGSTPDIGNTSEEVKASDTGSEEGKSATDTSTEEVAKVETADGGSVDSDIDLDAWNGELESLHQAPWWEKVPEDVRGPLASGIKTKYSNFHKGASKRISDALDRADKKIAAAEAKFAEAERTKEYVTQLLATGDEPNDVLNKQLEDLQKQLQEAADAQEAAITEKLEAEKAAWQEAQTAKERDWEAEKKAWQEKEKQYQAMQKDYDAWQTQELENAVVYANNVIQEKAPHIFEDEKLYGFYLEALNNPQFDDVDKVVDWVLWNHPAPKKEEEEKPAEKPPPGVTGMSMGGQRTSEGNADLYSANNFQELRRRLKSR